MRDSTRTEALFLRAGLFWAGAVLAFLLVPKSFRRAAWECLRPTTMNMIQLPKDCVKTDEAPPESAMRIVNDQRKHYELSLQRVVVCKVRGIPPVSGTKPDANPSILIPDIPKPWLPAYVGCCTYQFRRHFAVVVASAAGRDTVVVAAALVQNRWSYLNANWSKDTSYWY